MRMPDPWHLLPDELVHELSSVVDNHFGPIRKEGARGTDMEMTDNLFSWTEHTRPFLIPDCVLTQWMMDQTEEVAPWMFKQFPSQLIRFSEGVLQGYYEVEDDPDSESDMRAKTYAAHIECLFDDVFEHIENGLNTGIRTVVVEVEDCDATITETFSAYEIPKRLLMHQVT